MNWAPWILLAIGGAAGAVLRDLATHRWGAVRGVDLANRTGSVLLGVVIAAAAARALTDLHVAALGTGFAGGLTTFSTWVVQLVEHPGRSVDGRRIARETVMGLLLAAAAMAATTLALA